MPFDMSLLIFSFCFYFISFPTTVPEKKPGSYPFCDYPLKEELYKEATENNNEIFLARDSFQNPLFYYSNINSPVCYDNTCKPLQLKLFWDVCGNFLGFEIPAGKPLTKKDHKPFTQLDYYTLYTILNNPKAEISRMNKQDLVNFQTLAGPDAVSGATSSEVKAMVVDGAAYSTFTLWKIVYGSDLKNEKMPVLNSQSILEQIKLAEYLSVFELTLMLNSAEHLKLLRKYSIQKILTTKIDNISPFKALLINNYLQRQPFLPNDIQVVLKKCTSIRNTFLNMILY